MTVTGMQQPICSIAQPGYALLQRWLGLLRCPQCHGALALSNRDETLALQCQACPHRYPVTGGIPQLLRPERVPALEKFCAQYQALRLQEGWASTHPEYYLYLPFRDLSSRHVREWRLRARSFSWMQNWLKKYAGGCTLRILEAGAGSGWISQRLAECHEVIACDADAGAHGLGALPEKQRRFLAVRAELEDLPMAEHAFDLIIACASLHYAPNPETFFAQAHRILRPDGKLIVMDSPVYATHKAAAAAHQRSRAYYAQAGFPELANHYGGLLAQQFEQCREFNFVRKRRDFTQLGSFKKCLHEILGKEAAARFPIYIGQRLAAPEIK